MIYIFSAFYAEAKNIIDHYGLKKEKSPEMVRFDVFTNESIRLVITGVGEINAAAAVSNIGGAYGIEPYLCKRNLELVWNSSIYI